MGTRETRMNKTILVPALSGAYIPFGKKSRNLPRKLVTVTSATKEPTIG